MKNIDPDIRFVIEGCQVKRFHTQPVLKNETIGHHQGLIASLTAVIFPEMRPAFWQYIALHDIAESVTGDVPSTAKRLDAELKPILNRIEEKSFVDARIRVPMLTDYEHAVFKLLDNAAGLITCWYEVVRGNRLLMFAFTKFATYYAQCATRPGWYTMLDRDPAVRRLNQLVKTLSADVGLTFELVDDRYIVQELSRE